MSPPVLTNYVVRTELRLMPSSDGGARYEARWFLGSQEAGKADPGTSPTPDAHGLATVKVDGEVQIEVSAGSLPDWAKGFTEKLLRTTARGVQDGRYPRRLTRWRDAPA